MKKMFKVIAIISTIVIVLFFWYQESRNFYRLSNDNYVTVWKRIGGKCYVIQGKFYGMMRPSDNFIETTNRNAITILEGEKWGYKYIVSNDYNEPISFHFSQEKILYYNSEKRDFFVKNYFVNNKLPSCIHYLMIDIKENLAIVNGEKK